MVTLEILVTKRANLEMLKQQAERNMAQANADLNAMEGAIHFCDELIAEERARNPAEEKEKP
jgi:hypothetical protein